MTAFKFAPYEIFEIIAKTESTVSRFYTHLAGLGLPEEASKVFLVLAGEESDHGKTFLKMAQFQKESQGAVKESPVNLREILEGAIQRIDRSLLSLTPLEREKVDLRECLELAMRHEKDSIRVYEGLLRSMPLDFADVFEKTIAVEKGHLKTLEAVLKNTPSV